MTEQTTQKRKRRMAREPQASASEARVAPPKSRAPAKLDMVEALLLADGGASIAEMMVATGWQQHSLRGAMAGALKKRGLAITSEKVEGVRRYHAQRSA